MAVNPWRYQVPGVDIGGDRETKTDTRTGRLPWLSEHREKNGR